MNAKAISFYIVQEEGQVWYELTGYPLSRKTDIVGYEWTNKVIKITTEGVIVIRPPFRWDGRSGPAVDTANTLRSSAFHDAGYEMISRGVLPKSCRRALDRMMRQMDKEDGVSFFRRWYTYCALRLFGRGKKTYADRG